MLEAAFDSLAVKEYCVFAANYIWPTKKLGDEILILILRLDANQEFSDALKTEIMECNRRLPDFKRVKGYIVWDEDFPRTASMKIKRELLAEQIGKKLDRASAGLEI